MAEAVAVCSVYGGPDYRILLKGQASLLQYGFSTMNINLGRQVSFTLFIFEFAKFKSSSRLLALVSCV